MEAWAGLVFSREAEVETILLMAPGLSVRGSDIGNRMLGTSGAGGDGQIRITYAAAPTAAARRVAVMMM